MFSSRRITTMSGGDKFRDEYSLTFDGSNDFIATNNTFQSMLRGDFSITAWVKTTDGLPSGLRTICGSRNSAAQDWFYFGISGPGDNLGKLMIYYRANNDADIGYSDSAVFADGQSGWAHLAVSATKSTATNGFKMFFNGKLVGENSSNATTSGNWEAFTTINPVYIGGYNANGSVSNGWSGNISEVAFYSKALTAQNIATIYNGREPYDHNKGTSSVSSQTYLEGWWRMGDTRGASIYSDNNLVTNGDCEVTDPETITINSVVPDFLGASATTVTELKHAGSKSIKVLCDGPSGYPAMRWLGGDEMGLVVGNSYYMELWVYVPTGGEIDTCVFKYRDNSGTAVTMKSIGTGDFDGWVRMSGVMVIPDDITDIQILCYKSGSSVDIPDTEFFYIDDIALHEVDIVDSSGNSNSGIMVNMTADDFVGDTP